MAFLCDRHRPGRHCRHTCSNQKKNSIGPISSGYHISDRCHGHDDDDESSGLWPSRTKWGGAYSLGEKFPFLLERRYGIRAYDYWYGYTTAQIELMLIDQPVMDYGSKKSTGMGNSRADVDEMDALADKWAEKKAEEGSMKGETFSLSGFMKGEV